MRWRLIRDATGRPGAVNMAIDASLLAESNATGRAFLRLYRFNPPCLSLGRNEPADQYDRSAIDRLHLDMVRRPTGGHAVWHEDEVTYAVAAPIAIFGGLRKAYFAIHTRLVAALRSLGAPATLALHQPSPTSTNLHQPAPCFAQPVGGEVLVAGRKLIGSAQVRQGHAFLQHGAILLHGSQEMVRILSRQPSSVTSETTVSAVLRRRVSFDEVADAIATTWGTELTFTDLPQPPPTSTTLLPDLAPPGASVKS